MRGQNRTKGSAVRYEISGTIMQTVGIDLSPGETVYSQTATMAWMTAGVRMHTNTGGGLFAGIKPTSPATAARAMWPSRPASPAPSWPAPCDRANR
jgi:hypothetical protein